MVAFASIGYGAGHYLENQFSARFGIHQGACSSLLMWRMLHHHRCASSTTQDRIAQVLLPHRPANAAAPLDGKSPSAARLVRELCAAAPGMPLAYEDLKDVTVSPLDLKAFSRSLFDDHVDTLNKHCPEPFWNTEEILSLLQTDPGDL